MMSEKMKLENLSWIIANNQYYQWVASWCLMVNNSPVG